MHRQSLRLMVLGFALALAPSTADAFRLRTAALRMPPGGRLICTVENVSGQPIRITAEIIGAAGVNVTDFVSTSWLDEHAGILATVVSESYTDGARYCRVVVTGSQRRRSVRGTLEAFDVNGNPAGIAHAR